MSSKNSTDQKCFLPIHHPDFQYTESRNPYSAKLSSLTIPVFDRRNAESNQGCWRDRLGLSSSTPIHLEIGCNAGHVLVERARKEGASYHIGLDYKYKAIHNAALRAQKKNVSNVALLRAHAERIRYMFGADELDSVSILFPDPWEKNSQRKNRFIRQENLELLALMLKKDGTICFRTDHDEYFLTVMKNLEQPSNVGRFTIVSSTLDRHLGQDDWRKLDCPDVTVFEKMFMRQGIKIKEVVLKVL